MAARFFSDLRKPSDEVEFKFQPVVVKAPKLANKEGQELILYATLSPSVLG